MQNQPRPAMKLPFMRIILSSSIWSRTVINAFTVHKSAPFIIPRATFLQSTSSSSREVLVLSRYQHSCSNSRECSSSPSSLSSPPWSRIKPLSFSSTSHDIDRNIDNDDGSPTTTASVVVVPATTEELTMEKIYTEWTVDDDKVLFDNINKPVHKVASLLGRGLNGVIARKKKLKNVDSPAYKRLFIGNDKNNSNKNEDEEDSQKKLIPVLEVLRRIKWDTSLNTNDFTIQYFDRIEEKIHQCNFDQPNDSVKGKEEMFVFAIPEHRIQTILFRKRIVWDKESRLDCVFGSMNGNGETIYDVIETYDTWKQEEIEKEEFHKQRQLELANSIRYFLGDDLFLALKNMSKIIQEKSTTSIVTDHDVDVYVNSAMGLFRKADLPIDAQLSSSSDIEIELLSLFSDLVALLPDEELREKILLTIYQQMRKIENEKSPKKSMNQQLEKLNEDEITESFVKGSGSGTYS